MAVEDPQAQQQQPPLHPTVQKLIDAAQVGAVVRAGGAATTAPGVAVALPAVAAGKIVSGATEGLAHAIKIALVLRVLRALFRRRRAAVVDRQTGLEAELRKRFPDLDPATIRRIVQQEIKYEDAFQAKSIRRVEIDLQKAGQLDKAAQAKRVQQVIDREKHYGVLREKAMWARAIAHGQNETVKLASPLGAKWVLGAAKNHTRGCLALAGKNWPWAVLDTIPPPLHTGCQCSLQPLGPNDTVPPVGEAMSMARRAMALEEAIIAVADPGEIEAFLEGQPVRPTIERALVRLSEAYEERLHPRGRGGKWIGKLLTNEEAGKRMADRVLRWRAHEGAVPDADTPSPERIAANWKKQLRGRLSKDRVAIGYVADANRANAANPRWQALTRNRPDDLVLVTKKVPAGKFTSLVDTQAAAHRVGATTIISDENVRTEVDGDRLDTGAGITGNKKPSDHPSATSAYGLAGLLRHEYGHSIDDALPRDVRRHILDAIPNPGEDLGYYAGIRDNETIPELVATITHPDYDPEDFPETVQEAERRLRKALGVGPLQEAEFTERLHPRDRYGKWSFLGRLHTLTRSDIEAGHVPGVQVAGLASGVAGHAGFGGAPITLAPSGFDQHGRVSSVLLAHEAGHHLVNTVIKDGKVPPEMEALRAGSGRAAGRYGAIAGNAHLFSNPWKAGERDLPEEMIADGYADLLHGGAEFRYDGPPEPEPGTREHGWWAEDVAKDRAAFEEIPRVKLLKVIAQAAREKGMPDHALYRHEFSGPMNNREARLVLREAAWTENLHARNRLGRFQEMLGDKLEYREHHHSEASNENGKIVIGRKFLNLPDSNQDFVIAHELGHNVDDALLSDPKTAWVWKDESWADKHGDVLGGPQQTPGERIADAYGVAYTGDLESAKRWPAILNVAAEAKQRGMPIDPKIDALLKDRPPVPTGPVREQRHIRGKEPMAAGTFTAEDAAALPEDKLGAYKAILGHPGLTWSKDAAAHREGEKLVVGGTFLDASPAERRGMVGGLQEAHWTEFLHPRGRRGQWVDAIRHEIPHAESEPEHEGFTGEDYAKALDGFTHGGITAVRQNRTKTQGAFADVWLSLHRSGKPEPVGLARVTLKPPNNRGERVASIENVYLQEAEQNKGFGRAFTDHVFQTLRDGNVDRIALEAISIGGYSWARRGFRWDKDAAAEQRRILADAKADGRWERMQSHLPESHYAELERKLAAGEFSSESELAAYGIDFPWADEPPPEVHDPLVDHVSPRPGRTWLGKELLIGSRWKGSRPVVVEAQDVR